MYGQISVHYSTSKACVEYFYNYYAVNCEVRVGSNTMLNFQVMLNVPPLCSSKIDVASKNYNWIKVQ
jgi:hypothetical protein